MPDLPDAWPPPGAGEGGGTARVPMFPLPNVFLLPGTIIDVHVFEPRYTQMIEDCLDGPGRIAMACVPEEHHGEMAGSPPVHSIGGLGEIARHQREPRGRFRVWLAGLARASLREVPSDKPYRMVDAEPLQEIPAEAGEDRVLSKRVRAALLERNEDLLNLPQGIPLGHLTDLLLANLPLAQKSMLALYSELKVEERARRALLAHATSPPGGARDAGPDPA